MTAGPRRPRGRVLCVTSNFPRWPGDSTTPFVLFLAADLQDLGWEVDVLAPHAPGAARREEISGVRVDRFRYLWPAHAQTVCYGGGALINLRKQPLNLAKLPPLVAAEWAGVAKRLASRRYALLHSHWALPQGFCGALAAKPLRVPHVLTVHGEEFTAMRSPIIHPFKRFALHAADAVTANSSATEAQARQTAPRIDDLRRIPMGVDTSMAAPPELAEKIRSRYRSGDGPLLFSVGRLVDEKGVEDLLRAVPLITARLPDVSVVIGGAGQDEDTFRSLSHQLGIADRVTFAGFIPDDHLAAYYAAADVFVAPSRTGPDGWVEGQGITPLEAMIMRTPLVATTLGGYADTVIDERTALAVPERDPVAIAVAVERIVREPNLADRIVTEGHELAHTRFSRRASAEAFSALFEDQLAQRGVR